MHHIVGVKRKVTRYIFKMYRKTNNIPLYSGGFIMFPVITNIYNKKTIGPTLMELFTAKRKLNIFLTTRDVRCVHHGWHGTHRYDIQVLTTSASTCWRVCGKNLNIVSMCAVSPVVHTSNISSCKKKNFFNFPVADINSIKVGPLVFLLYTPICNHGEHYETPCISTNIWAQISLWNTRTYVTHFSN
jgi:hypothetical protein